MITIENCILAKMNTKFSNIAIISYSNPLDGQNFIVEGCKINLFNIFDNITHHFYISKFCCVIFMIFI